MAFIALAGAVVVIILIVLLLLKKKDGPGRYGELRADRTPDRFSAGGAAIAPGKAPSAASKPCPLCGTMLTANERVRSAVFPGKEDKLMHIFGCPNCAPPDGSRKRICPVCGAALPAEGYLIARVFEKPGKTHIHVLGCTGCRRG